MRYRLPMWVALTFLMLFTVLAAASFFLLQNHYRLSDQVTALEGTVASSQAQLDEVILNATAGAKQSSDVHADEIATRSAEQQQIEAVATADAQAALEKELASLNAAANQSPTVEIFTPEDGATVGIGDVVTVTVSATDAAGLISLDITADGESIGSFSAEDKALFTVTQSWIADVGGEIEIEALAVNINGIASEPVAITVIVEDREGAINDLVAKIEADVIGLRELEKQSTYTTTLMSSADLRDEIETLFEEEVTEEEARDDVIELYAFDFVDLDYDLYGALSALYGGSILGYYEADEDELVVVSDDSIVSPYEQLTLAHEITHALQDGNFGLDADEDEDIDSEASFALTSLAEGGATLVETLYLQGGYFTEDELEELFAEAREPSDVPSEVLRSLPELILNQQAFPYREGATFVQALYEQGGFEAVDEAWANPPLSTEHIMHPDTYFDGDVPQIVSLPPLTNTLGVGWRMIVDNVFGEFTLGEYLDQQLPQADSAEAAAGWGGDRYAVYWNDDEAQLAMALRLVWDSARDKNEFEIAFDQYARLQSRTSSTVESDGSICWISADVLCIRTLGPLETVIMRAPNNILMRRMVRVIR